MTPWLPPPAMATVDQALLRMLPGETVTFTIGIAATTEAEAFLGPSALRRVNQFLHRRDTAPMLSGGGGMQ